MTVRESEQIEHKQSLSEWRELVESVAAFATAYGGVISVGIGPEGRRVGVQLGNRSLEDLANKVKLNTEPPQYPSISVEGGEESAIVKVRVEESPIKPVWAFGQPFKRVGRSNQRLSPEETRRLMESTSGRTWDALPCPMFSLSEVDDQAIRDYLHRAGQSDGGAPENVLRNLGMSRDEGLSYAAVLLFATNPQRYIVDAQVKCARFVATDSVQFLDEQTLDGTVLTQVDRAVAFVARNTRQGIRFTGRPEREIVPEYPMGALREAITNAVCHRDYTVAGTVQVRIYDDRLEVWNPGLLPPDLSLEELYREHVSRPRNRLLAGAFYRARLIEHWGTGTLRMIRECEAMGVPPPEFQAMMGSFIVRFRTAYPGMVWPGAEKLTDRQRHVVSYVREHGSISQSQYRELTQVGSSQAKKDLSAMVQRGLLVRRGSGRTTEYVLAENLGL